MHADKQVFPRLDVMGWYATGEGVEPRHMDINRVVGGEVLVTLIVEISEHDQVVSGVELVTSPLYTSLKKASSLCALMSRQPMLFHK